MVGEKHEISVERAFGFRDRHLARAHVEMICGDAEIRSRCDRREPAADTIPRGNDRRRLRDEMDRCIDIRDVRSVLAMRDELRERGNGGPQHVHRPSVFGERGHEVEDRLRQRVIVGKLFPESVERRALRERSQ